MAVYFDVNAKDFQAELERVLPDLLERSLPIVDRAVSTTYTELKAAYPAGKTGDLRSGVASDAAKIEANGVKGQVHSWSTYAHMWEFGTQDRYTRQGWYRGKSPNHKQEGLVPISRRNRRQMINAISDIVREYGFEVGFSV